MEGRYTNMSISGDETNGYFFLYTNLNGQKSSMCLDAESYDDAVVEAASLADVAVDELELND